MKEEKKSGICRVCLNCDIQSKGLSIFEKQNNCQISEKINALTNVNIKEGDGLPDKICSACLLELETAFTFKLKCETANEVLLSAQNAPTQLDTITEEAAIKLEYLSDDFEYLDDNITLADLQAKVVQPSEVVGTQAKPSKAIDLKLICDDCGGSFKSKCKIRVHWKRVHLTEKLKCPICFRKFKSYGAYNSHKKKNLKSCATAGKIRIEGEGRHRTFFCKDCDYKTIRIKDMDSHIVQHTGERPYQCKICLKSFTQQSSLDSHMEGLHKVIKVEGTCHYCGKYIQGRNKFYRHMALHREPRFPCQLCNSVLKSRFTLTQHMQRHSGVKPFSCEVCPTTFFTYSELYNHKQKVHLRTKYFTCDICQYRNLCSQKIKIHKIKHTPTNVACNVCGTFLENEVQLLLHKKRHTDRNFPCAYCDKTYYARKNLSAHVRKKHRVVKLSETKVNSVKSEYSVEVMTSHRPK